MGSRSLASTIRWCAELLAKLGGAANGRRTLTYGVARDADIRLSNLRPNHNRITFDADLGPAVRAARASWKTTLPVLGHYNALNALAALAVATEASDKVIRRTLASFSGVKRRFTRVGEWNGAAVFDDYAHHPVEIASVLRAARTAGKGRIIAVIQPHRYTRLQSLFNEFSACLDDADIVLVTPVYSAGEAPSPGSTATNLPRVSAVTAIPMCLPLTTRRASPRQWRSSPSRATALAPAPSPTG